MHTLSSLHSGQLVGIKRLNLSCGLTEFPNEIFTLADSLEILNLSGNHLSELPDDLPRLHKLRVIFCSDNLFTELPEVLGYCENLEMVGFKANKISKISAKSLPKKLKWLILTDNKISKLPLELGSCQHLQKLMLAGNQLQDLPATISACSHLELLRISANRFNQLPEWLLSLPKLAWLAYAGNPCSDNEETAALQQSIAPIDWNSLTLQHILGEGASGIIYHAKLKSADFNAHVAVKIFKGTLTSDGLPRSEKAACIAAGAHPNLIPVIGKVQRHPDNISGLVMQLISPEFINLAQPPSLESCTRDIYATDTRFTLSAVLNMAHSIATVTEHLHTHGVMHGDLYAHNILWNKDSDCLLGDFGAASFLPRLDAALATNLQRIEVRAFACLLEELLSRCNTTPDHQFIVKVLLNLQQKCAQTAISARPLFKEINLMLTVLKSSLLK